MHSMENLKKLPKLADLAPEATAAYWAYDKAAYAAGAIPKKYKELMAIAVALTTQCPYCIKGHTKAAMKHGASPQEIMEAIWVAAEMRAGGAYAHSAISLTTMNENQERHEG